MSRYIHPFEATNKVCDALDIPADNVSHINVDIGLEGPVYVYVEMVATDKEVDGIVEALESAQVEVVIRRLGWNNDKSTD